MIMSELGLNMCNGRLKGLAPGKLAECSECHAIDADQSISS